MTIQQLVKHLKVQRGMDLIEQVRGILQDVLGEHTVYRPTSKWQQMLADLGLKELEGIAVCITCYSATSEIFNTIKTALKKKFKTVASCAVDDMGYRQVFFCGQSADAKPDILLCVNYYEDARTSVKATYNAETEDSTGSNNDTTNADEEIDIDDIDPFE